MNRRRDAAELHRGLPPDVFAHIVEAVPMQAAAERYGLAPDRRGWCLCPFHAEKTPSFKVYSGAGGFYCFGCGAGGDVLTFAERLFGLTAVQAAKKLDADFALGLFRDKPALQSGEWRHRKAERDAAEAASEARRWVVVVCLKRIHDLPAPQSGDDEYAALYALMVANGDYLEYAKEHL